MSETKDCVIGTKKCSQIITNFKFVHCCHGNSSRNDQTAKMAVFVIFREIFS